MIDALLWGLAILFYGVGDAVFTFLGVQYDNIEEASPVTRRLLGANPTMIGLILLKVASFGVFFGGYTLLEGNQYRDLIPIALTILGMYAVYNNSRAIVIERQS